MKYFTDYIMRMQPYKQNVRFLTKHNKSSYPTDMRRRLSLILWVLSMSIID